jgi:hypothetical protein
MGIHDTRHLAGATYCVYVQGISSGGAFVDKYCRQQYLTRLFNALKPYQVSLHAYTVLENEAFLLMTPKMSSGLSALVAALHTSFGEYYQTRFERDSIPISKNITASEVSGYELTLDCQKFIERLAVDVGLSDQIGTWQFSSYTANGFGCRPESLAQHRHYLAFLTKAAGLYPSYREYIGAPMDPKYRAYLLSRIKTGNSIAKKIRVHEGAVATKIRRWQSGSTKRLVLG